MRYPTKVNEMDYKNLIEKDLILYEELGDINLSKSLQVNLKIICSLFKNCHDIIIREFKIGIERMDAALIFVDGLSNKDLIDNQILKSLIIEIPILEANKNFEEIDGLEVIDKVKSIGLTTSEIKEENNFKNIILAALTGDAIFLIDNCDIGLVIGAKGWEKRGIQEPNTETVIRGPRDGFTETLRVNTALIRRRLRTPDLKMEIMRIGERTKTDTCVIYVESIVDKNVLKEVKKRIDKINIDAIYESGDIEELIEDNNYSPFPQMQYTERPDKVINAILEGRIALLIDGTPFVLLLPVTFFQFFQSPEDYYERWIVGSFVRVLRILAAYISAFTPALYIAAISFHPGLLPAQLMLAVAASREGVPFPPLIEALLMEFAFELLREAGVRLPRSIGSTVGIVGGLVIGQAAVAANLASPIMIIVVSITAIASFTIPAYNLAGSFRIIRFPLMLLAAYLGLYGVILGFLIMQIHMVSISSFGVTYYAPYVPYDFRDWKDLFICAPLRKMKYRPVITNPQDKIRQGNYSDKE